MHARVRASTCIRTPATGTEFAGQPVRYTQSVLRLFTGLHDPSKQRVVVNLDDAAAGRALKRAEPCPAVTYSLSDPRAHVMLERQEADVFDTTMYVVTPLGRLQIIMPLLGRHNVQNVLAAVAVGLALNVSLKNIVAGIESVDFVPGRCEVIDATPEEDRGTMAQQKFGVVVDGADDPWRLAHVLQGLRDSGARRVFTVLGCEGLPPRPTLASVRARLEAEEAAKAAGLEGFEEDEEERDVMDDDEADGDEDDEAAAAGRGALPATSSATIAAAAAQAAAAWDEARAARRLLRAAVGHVAHTKSDVVIVANNSPGGEDPGEVVADIVAGWPREMRKRWVWVGGWAG